MLNPIFKPFIPVFSLSLASNSIIQFFPSVVAVFSLSISSSYPNFISPPSFTLIGGSSTIVFSISSYMSSNVSNSEYNSVNNFDCDCDNILLTSGNCFAEL